MNLNEGVSRSPTKGGISDVILLQLLAIALLVVLNGFFVASEFAIVKVRSSQLAALTAQANRRVAVDARQVTAHLEAYLSGHPAGQSPGQLGLSWLGRTNPGPNDRTVFRPPSPHPRRSIRVTVASG